MSFADFLALKALVFDISSCWDSVYNWSLELLEKPEYVNSKDTFEKEFEKLAVCYAFDHRFGLATFPNVQYL